MELIFIFQWKNHFFIYIIDKKRRLKFFFFNFTLQQEIEAYRQRSELSVHGRNVPKPVLAFEEASFPSE